jgi:hypothetical protein
MTASNIVMTTHFVFVEISLQGSPRATHQEIESVLQEWGKPLRWAVTTVDEGRRTAIVEAIVTRSGDHL